jgi:hypothetical protein
MQSFQTVDKAGCGTIVLQPIFLYKLKNPFLVIGLLYGNRGVIPLSISSFALAFACVASTNTSVIIL